MSSGRQSQVAAHPDGQHTCVGPQMSYPHFTPPPSPLGAACAFAAGQSTFCGHTVPARPQTPQTSLQHTSSDRQVPLPHANVLVGAAVCAGLGAGAGVAAAAAWRGGSVTTTVVVGPRSVGGGGESRSHAVAPSKARSAKGTARRAVGASGCMACSPRGLENDRLLSSITTFADWATRQITPLARSFAAVTPAGERRSRTQWGGTL